MSFTTSINIERDFGKTPHYIVTANARQTIGKIINHFASGIHSFCLIGSYGHWQIQLHPRLGKLSVWKDCWKKCLTEPMWSIQ